MNNLLLIKYAGCVMRDEKGMRGGGVFAKAGAGVCFADISQVRCKISTLKCKRRENELIKVTSDGASEVISVWTLCQQIALLLLCRMMPSYQTRLLLPGVTRALDARKATLVRF